jgi:hypothetical protein
VTAELEMREVLAETYGYLGSLKERRTFKLRIERNPDPCRTVLASQLRIPDRGSIFPIRSVRNSDSPAL